MKTTPITMFLDRTAPFCCEISTRIADVDFVGHINNIATSEIFEDARNRFTDALRILDFREADVRFLTVSTQVDYLAEAHYPAPFVVHCAVGGIGRSSWTYIQTAYQEGRIVAAAVSTQVATRSGRGWAFPGSMRDRLAGASVPEERAVPPTIA